MSLIDSPFRIALMLGNRSDDPAFKTTLIVAPVALLLQWKEEIERISRNALSVFIHHGKDKAKHHKEFKRFDVVITSTQVFDIGPVLLFQTFLQWRDAVRVNAVFSGVCVFLGAPASLSPSPSHC